jgi:tetratricopeptide (TPR) repeat protein
MDYLLFQLKRIVGLLISIDLLGIIWDGSGRSNNLVLGLPSVIIGTVGFCAVFFMQWGGTGAMIKKYSDRVQTNVNREELLEVDLRQSLISQLALADGGATDAAKVQKLRAEDPRTTEINALSDESIIYLNKLITLEPENKNHLYQLAVRFFKRGDQASKNRAIAILQQIAPLDQPGLPAAHLQLAQRLERLPANSAMEKRANIDTALEHIKQCLTRDSKNFEALKVKARLLRYKGSNKESREVFEQLFEENPVYFTPLLKLGISDAQKATVLDSAANRYLADLRKKDVRKDTIKWVRTWEGVASVLLKKKDFPKLKELLEKDLQQYSQGDETAGRVPFLKQHLCRAYLGWAIHEVGNPLTTIGLPFDESEQRRLLEFYTKAYSYNEKNQFLLQNLAKLGGSSFPAIVKAATEIYDPSASNNLPPGVLNQIALEALNKGNYREAQQYYERAKSISPNNPGILNNLAYAYLKADGDKENPLTEDERISNASRAHRLVEQAIRLLPNGLNNSSQMSMYRHTMGTALMQLGNYPGAAAQFELALRARPTEEELLESVIDCYERYKLDVGPYQRQLDEVRKDKQDSSLN